MRVSYSIPYGTFVSLEPPFVPIGPIGRGLCFMMYFAVTFAGAGFVVLFVRLAFLLHLSPYPGGSLSKAFVVAGLGSFPLAGIWLLRKISANQARRQQEDFLRDTYQRLHCRDERFFETVEDGLLFGCCCRAARKKWPEFNMLLETDQDFVLGFENETHAIPKAAFHSEADRTGFRALLSAHLAQNKSFTARAIEFTCTRADWRNAWWLQFKLGAWLGSAGWIMLAALEVVAILFFVPFLNDIGRLAPPFEVGACVFVLLLAFANSLLRQKRTAVKLPLKIWIAEDAIYLQSPVAEARIPWSHITACIYDQKSLLLLHNARPVVVIPQRFIAPAQREYVLTVLRAKLPPSPRQLPSVASNRREE